MTDSASPGTDNLGLKPRDSVINDMSSSCDPCSLAVMPRVEPRELWRVDERDLYNYAWAQRNSLWQTDRTLQDLYCISNETCAGMLIKKESSNVATESPEQ